MYVFKATSDDKPSAIEESLDVKSDATVRIHGGLNEKVIDVTANIEGLSLGSEHNVESSWLPDMTDAIVELHPSNDLCVSSLCEDRNDTSKVPLEVYREKVLRLCRKSSEATFQTSKSYQVTIIIAYLNWDLWRRRNPIFCFASCSDPSVVMVYTRSHN